MGNYSIANVFQKEPAVIAGAIRSVLWVLVLAGLVEMNIETLAAIALALEFVLGLFVRQTSTPTFSPSLIEGTLVSNPAKSGGDAPPPDLIVARVEDVQVRP